MGLGLRRALRAGRPLLNTLSARGNASPRHIFAGTHSQCKLNGARSSSWRAGRSRGVADASAEALLGTDSVECQSETLDANVGTASGEVNDPSTSKQPVLVQGRILPLTLDAHAGTIICCENGERQQNSGHCNSHGRAISLVCTRKPMIRDSW